MTITVLVTGNTFTAVFGIAHKQRTTLVALRSNCVVVTLDALIQLVRTTTIGMAVTLTLDAAVGADIPEIAQTHIRIDASATNATLRTHRNAFTFDVAGLVSITTLALISIDQVDTALGSGVTVVMLIDTLILGWTLNVIPIELILWINCCHVLATGIDYITGGRQRMLRRTFQRALSANTVTFESRF